MPYRLVTVAPSKLPLEFEENLSPIEPIAHVPHHQQDRAGLGNGGEVSDPCKAESEHPDRSVQPRAQNLLHRVNEIRIRADYDEVESPPGVTLHLDHPVESEEHQQ